VASGYVRKELQILGGGFNLLPPGDKTPKTDYLLAQNWRVDRSGKLVSRYGYPLQFSITGPSYAHSAAIFGGVEGDYYVAANALLGANPCAVYWNSGAVPIVTGLSGRRVGFAPMNSWMWIMDSAVQGRHNGALGFHNWGIDPPAVNCTAAVGAANASGPNGTYQFYMTFSTTDQQFESNPGPVSNSVTVAFQNVALTGLELSTDPQVGIRNIYATGGTLGQAYLVGTIYDNVTTTFVWSTNDLTVANDGVAMAINHDPPPAGAGLAGPYLSRLFTWVGNRLFWTDPNLPQYWPGSQDAAVGNWVDVGMDGEDILWCTVHTNIIAIYKERSVWRLVGDPDTGTLEQMEDGTGLVSAFAIVAAGKVDYFVAPNGLRVSNLDATQDISGAIAPLFNSNIVNAGPLTLPGSILPGPDFLATSLDAYGIALGYAMGKLYVAYNEQVTGSGQSSVLLVRDELSGRWMYHRTTLAAASIGFQGFLFDGIEMVGLTGTGGAIGGTVEQLQFSVPGTIGIAVSAAPLVSLPTASQPAAIAALLKSPAIGGPITLQLLAGATVLGTLTIPEGATMATSSGTLAAVAPNAVITLSITGVGAVFPGGDLTVLAWFYTGAGSVTNSAVGYSLDDFRAFFALDQPAVPIQCIYQSHFEDAGLPDNQKNWLEVVVDYELLTDVASIWVAYDNGALGSIGTITGTGPRKQTSFALGTDGVLAKNISVAVNCNASNPVVIHNVYLYYYVEARLALAASTLPTDLGSAKVKQCKELQLDIDATLGNVNVNVYSDLPGNALAVRQTPTVTVNAGRALLKFPFSVTEGYLWRLALKAATGAFRLYSARLLMRVIGTYIEAYEAAAGFVWDSMEQNFETGLTHIPRAYGIALAAVPIKRFREISLEIDTFNANVTLTFLTDLPGNSQASRFTATVNTGVAGRRYVRLTIAAGTTAPVEGRTSRLQLSGSAKFVLYDAAVELLAVGVYIEAYEAAGGAVYDSREIDFGSVKPKEAREIELDIEGAVTATLYSDLPGFTMASVFTQAVSTTGRQKIRLPLTVSAALSQYPMGRMFRLILTGTAAYRLYGAKLALREFGTYLTGDEATASPAGVWDSTPLDLGTERSKSFKKLEFDLQTDGVVTVKVYTDQPAGTMATSELTTTIDTSGARETVVVVLPPGVRGRLFQVEVSGHGVRLFSGRVWWRPLNEPKASWKWDPLPIEPTTPKWEFAPFSVAATEPQWIWAKVLSVEDTPDTWTWVDVPFDVSGQ
jgi:hypothetical protein